MTKTRHKYEFYEAKLPQNKYDLMHFFYIQAFGLFGALCQLNNTNPLL